MRIFILLGHPSSQSFNGALADAYAEAARAAGHEVRRQDLGWIDFDPGAIPRATTGDAPPPDAADLRAAQTNLAWCERFVLVYPMWWGSMPARLKSWFEQVLTPGFAFRYHANDPMWDALLGGREAHILRTSDAPALYARFVYHDCDIVCLRRAILGFCGIRTRRVLRIGGVGRMRPAARKRAIARARRMV